MMSPDLPFLPDPSQRHFLTALTESMSAMFSLWFYRIESPEFTGTSLSNRCYLHFPYGLSEAEMTPSL